MSEQFSESQIETIKTTDLHWSANDIKLDDHLFAYERNNPHEQCEFKSRYFHESWLWFNAEVQWKAEDVGG